MIHVHAALAVRGAATDSQCGMHMNHEFYERIWDVQ